jgi:hypothetical protein
MDNAVAVRTAAVIDADDCDEAAAAATAGAGAAPDPKIPGAAAPVSGVAKSSAGGEDCVVGALVACAIAAAIKACAAAPLSVADGSPLGAVLPRAAALPSFEVGADVAAAMFALPAVTSMGAAPSVALATCALDAAGTRAVGAEVPAAPDNTVETGEAVGSAVASGAVIKNPGGMPAPPAGWLPAPSCVKPSCAAAMVAGDGAAPAGGAVPAGAAVPADGVESAARGGPLAPALAVVPGAATEPVPLPGFADAASVFAGGGGVTASGG